MRTTTRSTSAQTAAPKPGRGTWRRRWLLRIALVMVALGVGLVVAEILLRRSMRHMLPVILQMPGWFAEESGGIHMTPGLRGELTIGGRTTQYEINSLGMRGPEVGVRRPGERRLLCVGDSMTFGNGIQYSESFAARLEAALSRPGAPVTVGNAGVPGTGQVMQTAMLGRLKDRFAPDLVLSCVFSGNDFVEDSSPPLRVVGGTPVSGPMGRLMESSFRARLAFRFRLAFLLEQSLDKHVPALAIDRTPLLPAPEDRIAAVLPPIDLRAAGLFMDAIDETPQLASIMERVLEALEKTRQLAAPAPLLVALLPPAHQLTDAVHGRTLKKVGFDPSGYRRGASFDRLAARCRERGFELIDLRDGLGAVEDVETLYIQGDGHLTARGHELVAQQIGPVAARMLAR